MTNTEKLIFAFMVIPVGFCFTMMESDLDIALAEEFQYCSDVELWKTFEMTDGSSQYGHPDFKGIYKSVCMPKYRMTDL
jgi:hypothetical protein